MADISTITLPNGNEYNLKDNNAIPSSEKAVASGVATLDSNGLIPQSQMPGMVILSYGNNTWDDFLAAYQKNNIIYCRASSNSNPASGSQTRLAFMAYVNNATSPTEVEFQYYRSVSSHSATQQGDQVYVYKLNKSSGWSVTVRETYTRVVTNNGLTSTWSSGILTAKADLVSDTKLTNSATEATEVSGRVYPVSLDINGKLAVNVPWEDTTYTASSSIPLMDGTADVGTSADYARGDHVHPSDSSKVPTTRTINNKALSSDITLSASDVNAVPTTRTINGHVLSSDVTITSSDVSAVPTTRKVNGKALSSDITLTASDVSAIASSEKGIANGVATLDSNGLVPSSQLPAYVDDVLEYSSINDFPATGEAGKIYVDTSTNTTYRWSGTTYVEISPSLALGETSSTAYRGDRGKIAYDHATDTSRVTTAQSSGLYKISVTSQGHIAGVTSVQKSDITNLGIPGSVPTAVSELTNDSNYQTDTQVDNLINAEAGKLIPYGYCETAAATDAKTVTVSPAVSKLELGLMVAVKFQYANGVANPTLNVNNLGAKSIKRYGTTAPGTSAASSWNANSVVVFTYDGTYWQLTDHNNTTYSGMSDAEYQAGTSTTNRLISPARLKAAIELYANTPKWTIDNDGTGETSLQAVVQNDIENNIASGTFSYASGQHTTASGSASHSEGIRTRAVGYSTHAEGYYAYASGRYSHVEGNNTRATHLSQHVFGENNALDPSSAGVSERGTYVEIVGNGTADDARSNARTLDWSGNETLAGKLTVGVDPTLSMDVTTKQYVDGKRVYLTQAEYDALTPTQKSADVVYYITDADYSMPDVVTLSKAEYDLLPTEEKNNGLFYYVYDDTTTASTLVVQTNQDNANTVPSSKVVYDEMSEIRESLSTTDSRVNANHGASAVSLKGYTSTSNMYTFPADGYVFVSSEAVASGAIRVVIAPADAGWGLASIYMNITATYQIQSMYVKKGMNCYVTQCPSGAIVNYSALTY